MSKSGKIAYALLFSSATAAFWYAIWSYVLHREQFQALFLLGFLALALVSALVYWPQRRAKFTQTRRLSAGTLLTNLGMLWIATGLAGLGGSPETGALIFTLTVGPILVLIGLIIVSVKDSNDNTEVLGGEINSER